MISLARIHVVQILNNFLFDTGRRPFKLLPTDEEFSAALIESTKDSFTRTLPKCVEEDLHNKDESRIIFLWSGYVTGFDEYLAKFRKRQRTDTGTIVFILCPIQ